MCRSYTASNKRESYGKDESKILVRSLSTILTLSVDSPPPPTDRKDRLSGHKHCVYTVWQHWNCAMIVTGISRRVQERDSYVKESGTFPVSGVGGETLLKVHSHPPPVSWDRHGSKQLKTIYSTIPKFILQM